MEIQCTINHQTLTIEQRKLANHSQKYLEISFDFKTDDWNGLTKFALFHSHGKTYRVPLTNDKATAPNAVLTGDRFSIGAYGLGEDELRVTTNQCRFSLAESGYTIDIENDLPDDDPTVVEQIYIDINNAKSEAESYADTGLAGKSDIGHTHTESDITDLKEYALAEHNHDTRYYTETEVNNIIDELKHDLLNRCNLTSDRQIMQTDETADITAYLIENGIPKANTIIYFYKEEDL